MAIQPMAIGLALGMLIGIITGAIFTFMLNSLYRTATFGDGMKVIGEMLATPTFWFGGPWLATRTLTNVDWANVLPWYAATLAVVFGILAVIPTFRFIARIAEKLQNP